MALSTAQDEVRRELAARLATGRTRLPAEEKGPRMEPGRLVALQGPLGSGMTKVGLSLLVEPSRRWPVVVVDHRGWFSPPAAWEVGVEPSSLYVVRVDTGEWASVMAALLGGVRAIYADVPPSAAERDVRRLAAIARRERAAVALRSVRPLPAGIVHWRMTATGQVWEGPDRGHGRVERRTLSVTVAGKAAGGRERRWEVEDDGANSVRMVERLAAAPSRRAAG